MSQNLLAPDSNMPTPISVADNDVNAGLPEDLTDDSVLPFWKQPNMKIWIYVLGGSIAIFAVIFVLLSQQSSLFKGSTIDTTTIGGDQELFFGEYGESTTSSTDSSSSTSTSTTTSTDDQAILGTTTTTTSTTTTNPDTSEQIITDSLAFDPADIAPTFTETLPAVYDEFSEVDLNPNIEQDLFGAGFNDAGELAYVEEVIAEPSLVTNTSASVMQAPNVQGNTGPALWLSLFPALLFIGYRFVKKQV